MILISAIFWVTALSDDCLPFHQIYADGKELCEKMWGTAFVVVDDSEPSYTMWFFDETNPNNDVTDAIFGAGTADAIDECHLQYFHKDAPGPESDNFTECHPWKNNACCHEAHVVSVDNLRTAYGAGFEWDRCGPMSQACERFFVQEVCFYECEPSAGLYRKYDASMVNDPDYNEWQMEGMPIKKSYCDAWFTACRNDLFCGNGDYFACNENFWETSTTASPKEEDERDISIAFIIIVCIIACIFIAAIACMITKEKQGKPMFGPLVDDKREPGNAELGNME